MKILDNLKDLFHQNGSQAHGGFIQHQELGAAHQRPSHGQHLLFAAGQRARHLLPPLLQAGELRVDLLQVRRIGFAALGVGAHLQVFLGGHLQKDPPSLRHQGQAAGDHLVGRNLAQILPQEGDGAGFAPQQSGDGVQGGGFARAVGADQRDDLPLGHLEGHALDGVDAAVVDIDVVDFQDCFHVTPPSACRDTPR